MSTKNTITDEERLFLRAVFAYGRPAYGIEIHDHLAANGLEMTLRRIYPVLRDLEEREYLESSEGEPLPERGGRARRYYALTTKGIDALNSVALVRAAPRAPTWWRRALKSVIPSSAIRQVIFSAISDIDPKTLRAIVTATSQESSADDALQTALRTAFEHTRDPDDGGAPGDGGATDLATDLAPDAVPSLDDGGTMKVPVRDIVKGNERIQFLTAENEALRTENEALRTENEALRTENEALRTENESHRAAANAGPRFVKIAVMEDHDAPDDITHIYLARSDGAIVEVDHEAHGRPEHRQWRESEGGRRWLAENANRAPSQVLLPLSQEPKGLDWIEIS
jgi:DNA-binding PadR family transcriptional regulator/regulator of replication initiation timing